MLGSGRFTKGKGGKLYCKTRHHGVYNITGTTVKGQLIITRNTCEYHLNLSKNVSLGSNLAVAALVIKIRDIHLGTHFPAIKSITVKDTVVHEGTHHLDMLELCLDLEYSGGFQLSIDANMLLGKAAFLSVKVNHLSGLARLQFTRHPYTHWSFSFYSDPVLELQVESQFQGRPLPQINSIIVSQIRKSLKKKHTLPYYKLRYKPFFAKCEPGEGEDEWLGHTLCPGTLQVTVAEVTRLMDCLVQGHIYCSLAVGTTKSDNLRGTAVSKIENSGLHTACIWTYVTITASFPHADHPGMKEILQEITQQYTWDGVNRYVEAYVQQCYVCVNTKAHGVLKMTAIPHRPVQSWTQVAVDLIPSEYICKTIFVDGSPTYPASFSHSADCETKLWELPPVNCCLDACCGDPRNVTAKLKQANCPKQRRGNSESPEKIRRPVASYGMIPTCENLGVIRLGIQTGLPLHHASRCCHQELPPSTYRNYLLDNEAASSASPTSLQGLAIAPAMPCLHSHQSCSASLHQNQFQSEGEVCPSPLFRWANQWLGNGGLCLSQNHALYFPSITADAMEEKPG
ncbi:hypothetical protein PR048_021567 [Dryococelus australis]|uniref:SMP-LTD domain-containing protein n=1 Tax=Dryococelus australis TaxID=614101 RepID=A0ABQ9GYL6_9NEOP|nr:hypothetical protein PR048_021567 [Dryococelus australis]